MANNTSLEAGDLRSRRESDADNITVAQAQVPIRVNSIANRDTDQRIQDLEQKVAEQEKINSGVHDDIKSLKALQNGDRAEFQKGLEYHELKKKKLFALVGELSNSRELLATKSDLQSLSKQLDDLKTLVDHAAAGMHASGPPPAPDMIDFSPARSLIHFGENTPARPLTVLNQNAQAQSLPTRPGRVTSPLEEHGSSEGAISVDSFITRKTPSPYVHITPPAEDVQLAPAEQAMHSRKKVRFDLVSTTKPGQTRASARLHEAGDDEQTASVISDSGSEDILAPDATVRKNALSKQAKKSAASNKASPIVTTKRSGASRRKSIGILEQLKVDRLNGDLNKRADKQAASDDARLFKTPKDSRSVRRKSASILERFKDGRFNVESDDEDDNANNPTPSRVPGSDDMETMIGLAEKAVTTARRASLATPAVEPVAGTRRSQRAPKPKDFGDVVEHGWKRERTRRS